MSIHRGLLDVVDGNAVRPNEPVTKTQSHVGRDSFDIAAKRTQARDALVGLGWKPPIARAAVDEAMSHVGREAALEALIFEALRRCPRPATG